MPISTLNSIIGSLIVGASIAYVITYRLNAQMKTKVRLLEEKRDTIKKEKEKREEQINSLLNEISDFRNQSEALKITSAKYATSIELLNKQLEDQMQWKTGFEEAQKEINFLEKQKLEIEVNLEAEKEKLIAQKENFEEQKRQLTTEFKNLAAIILKSQSDEFAQQSKKDINLLIEPLKEKIEDFKKQVSNAYTDDARERFSLKNEIKNLIKLNKDLSQEAKNLSLALKGDNKTQGDWGEMILESILENSGLSKGREYYVQQNIKDDNNKNFRPDVVVKYPGNRCVIIDSKVSLKHYEQYVNAEDTEQRDIALKAHIDSIKRHIKELSAKNYQNLLQECKSPDFVMMFLPVEPAYIIAVQSNVNLWQEAYQKQILLISPTNLITALRMISELWEHDKQNKNVLKIAEESGKLVDKFVNFLEDFDKIGDHIRKSEEMFNSARKKIKGGQGNLISKVEHINKLGANAKKTIPTNFLELDE